MITKQEAIARLGELKDKLIAMQRFQWWFKLLLLSPGIAWFAEFNLSKYIPNSIRPVVDTTTLPYLESQLLYGYNLLHWPRNVLEDHSQYNGLVSFLDLLAGFVYVIHFAFAFIFAFLMYLYYRKKVDPNGKPYMTPWAFLWIWGLVNFTAVTVQLIWATAPPWYVEIYGTKPPSYGMKGDPAGLTNADHVLHFPLFKTIYGNSPIVFGSFPSLHGAWPIMITLFTPPGKGYKIAGTIYASLVWWAAMYLNHHYLTDLLGGLFFVIVNYMGGMVALNYFVIYFKDRIYGPAAAKLRFTDEATVPLDLVIVHHDEEEEKDNGSLKLKKIVSRDDAAISNNSSNTLIPIDEPISFKVQNDFKANEKHL